MVECQIHRCSSVKITLAPNAVEAVTKIDGESQVFANLNASIAFGCVPAVCGDLFFHCVLLHVVLNCKHSIAQPNGKVKHILINFIK